MIKHIKSRLKNILPVEGVIPPGTPTDTEKYLTLSLKRSGQHAVINWLCSQIQDILHFNHCHFERRRLCNWVTPVNNRVILYKGEQKLDSGIQSYDEMLSFLLRIHGIRKFLYSLENFDIENTLAQKYILHSNPIVILIIRDPYNWLASTIKHPDTSLEQLYEKKSILIKYLNQALHIRDYISNPVVTINYNRWVTQKDYRIEICHMLDIPFSDSADQTLMQVPDFGGGSSFSGTREASQDSKRNIFTRWQDYATDQVYKEILNDKDLTGLAEHFFQMKKPF